MPLTFSVRRLLLFLALFLTAAAQAATAFVSPLEGSQAIGLMVLEVTTDATNVDRVEFLVDGVLAGVARTKPYRIAYDFGTNLDTRTITAKVWSNGYKTSETATVTTAGLSVNDTLNVDLVEVAVRVRSARALKPADLRVRENGVNQEIRDIRQERPPAHFAFVVDRSLSMGGGKLEAAMAAIRSAAKQLRPGDTASVVLFNHNVDKARSLEATQSLELIPTGGTSLRDALASLDTKQRTYAFVITDGGDRNSQLTDEQALRKISGTRTIVSAVVLGDAHAKFLDRAAKNTGGTVVSASRDTVSRELGKLMTDVNSRYLVIYQSNATKRGWRTLDVIPRTRGVEVTASRKGYFAE